MKCNLRLSIVTGCFAPVPISVFLVVGHQYFDEVEIHRSRGAPLKDYNGGLQKKVFFSISSLWLR